MRRLVALAALMAAALSTSPTRAEDGQWAQITNLPKGLNVAPGVKLAILGIEPGATIDEVRPIVAELAKAHVGAAKPSGGGVDDIMRQFEQGMLDGATSADTSPPLQEILTVVSLPVGNGDSIKLEYTGRIDLARDLAGSRQNMDTVQVVFSAPSSGHQVIGVTRSIRYLRDADQPRIAPILDDLKARFGEPMVVREGSYRWQFDNGVAVHTSKPDQHACWPYIGDVTQEREIETINTRSGGDCDVVLDVRIAPGISSDHAAGLSFTLSDNERGKANLRTDFDFFYDYVDRYRDNIEGEKPAL